MISNINLLKKLFSIGELLFLVFIVLTPLITFFSFQVNLITTKLLWFSFFVFCFILIFTVNFFLQDKKTNLQLNLNLIDLSVIFFILYVHLNFLFLGKSYVYAMLTPFSLILCLYIILKFKVQIIFQITY